MNCKIFVLFIFNQHFQIINDWVSKQKCPQIILWTWWIYAQLEIKLFESSFFRLVFYLRKYCIRSLNYYYFIALSWSGSIYSMFVLCFFVVKKNFRFLFFMFVCLYFPTTGMMIDWRSNFRSYIVVINVCWQ